MKPEFVVVADRDDTAGSGPVLVGEDRETLDRFVGLSAALLELRRFGRELVGPVVFADLLKFAEMRFDALNLGLQLGRNLDGCARTSAYCARAPY
jgi:hypothetical protein